MELTPKKVFLLVGGAAVLILVFLHFFTGPPKGRIQDPPEGLTTEEYKDWIAEKTYQTIYDKRFINIGYEEPTKDKLDDLKQKVDLTRKYPPKIHALFEIGKNTVPLIHFSQELKNLGVNTYVVQAEANLKDGKIQLFQPGYTRARILSQEEAKRVIIHRMLLAKQEGFAVSFVPDYPELFDIGKDEYNIDELEPQFIELALDWAKIAEEYGLEYFSPINEYEKLLKSNGYGLDFIYQRTNNFYSKLIPEIRKVFSGKVIVKTGCLGDWENHRNLDFQKADLFGVGVWYAQSKEEISRDMQEMVNVIDEISARDDTPWLITEYYIATPKEVDLSFSKEGVKTPMEDAYRAGINEFTKAKNAVGFTFTGYIGGGRIRGTGAVPVLKSFFERY